MPSPPRCHGGAHAWHARRHLELRDPARDLAAPRCAPAGAGRGGRRPRGHAAVTPARSHRPDAGHPAAGRRLCAHRPGQPGTAAVADAGRQSAHAAAGGFTYPAPSAGAGQGTRHPDAGHRRHRPRRHRHACGLRHRALPVGATVRAGAGPVRQPRTATRLRDVYLRLHGHAQGGGHPPSCHRPAGLPTVLRPAGPEGSDAARSAPGLRCLDAGDLGPAAQWRHLRRPSAGHPLGCRPGRDHPHRTGQHRVADRCALQPHRRRGSAAPAGPAHADDRRRGAVAPTCAPGAAGAARTAADQRLRPHRDHHLRRHGTGVRTRSGQPRHRAAGPPHQLDLRARAEPAGRRRSPRPDRRALHRRPRRGPGLPEPSGSHEGALRHRPVRWSPRHALPYRRRRALARRRPPGIPRPAGWPAQDPRLSHRTGRDRGRTGQPSGRGQCRHHRRMSAQWRAPPGGLAGGGRRPDTAR